MIENILQYVLANKVWILNAAILFGMIVAIMTALIIAAGLMGED